VNREANGATVRAAERDAFGLSWTFAHSSWYWRATQPLPHRIPGRTGRRRGAFSHPARGLGDLDLLLVFWSGYLFAIDSLVQTLAGSTDARLRVLIIDTCHADDRMRRLQAAIAELPDDRRPTSSLPRGAADGRARENSVNGHFHRGAAAAACAVRGGRARERSTCSIPSTVPRYEAVAPVRPRNRCSPRTASSPARASAGAVPLPFEGAT
jgi:hypothetical protein